LTAVTYPLVNARRYKGKDIDVDADGTVDNSEKVGGYLPVDLEKVSNKGVANGYAGLDANARVPVSQLPPIERGSNLSSVRSMNTVYQNNNSTPILLIVSAQTNYVSGSFLYIYADTVNPPANIISKTPVPNTNTDYFIAGVIEPNEYYKVIIGNPGQTGTQFANHWFETILHKVI